MPVTLVSSRAAAEACWAARRVNDPLVKRAEAELKASNYHELRSVKCDVRSGLLMLFGRVSSFYLKQMAQTVVARVLGDTQMVNRLEVGEPATRPNRGRLKFANREPAADSNSIQGSHRPTES